MELGRTASHVLYLRGQKDYGLRHFHVKAVALLCGVLPIFCFTPSPASARVSAHAGGVSHPRRPAHYICPTLSHKTGGRDFCAYLFLSSRLLSHSAGLRSSNQVEIVISVVRNANRGCREIRCSALPTEEPSAPEESLAGRIRRG